MSMPLDKDKLQKLDDSFERLDSVLHEKPPKVWEPSEVRQNFRDEPRQLKVVFRKYIKWSTLGDVVIYVGKGPNGKTLSAIRQLREEADTREIVTNLGSLRLPHTKFDLTESLDYHNKRIFLDSATSMIPSRLLGIERLFKWVFDLRRHTNCKYILTASQLHWLPWTIRRVATILMPEYMVNKHGTPYIRLVRYTSTTVVIYPWVRTRKYFKYFDTKEFISLESLQSVKPQTENSAHSLYETLKRKSRQS